MFGTMQQQSTGSGSGVIIGKNDTELLIATNNHVVSGAESLTVCFNDDKDAVFDAKIKGTDADNDLAVIAIKLSDISEDVLNSISVATLGDSTQMEVGDQVVAIGNALGFGQSVTSGVISALDREVTIDDTTATLMQTDAAINPGNSGGALFNMKGEVIGINSAKYASDQVEGMGFAIPMAKAQGIIENLMDKVDNLILCGGMTYTFAKAQGGKIGNSIVEDDKLELALDIIAKAKAKGVNLVLGTDCVAADAFSNDANTQIVPSNNIPDGWEGLDAGPETQKSFAAAIENAKTILWNGPAGVFEFDNFTAGSRAIAEAIAKATKNGAFSLIGGGDSVACINKFGMADQVSYISTGGGALLEAIEGKILPGIAAIRGDK